MRKVVALADYRAKAIIKLKEDILVLERKLKAEIRLRKAISKLKFAPIEEQPKKAAAEYARAVTLHRHVNQNTESHVNNQENRRNDAGGTAPVCETPPVDDCQPPDAEPGGREAETSGLS